jgi:periplasmic divalent cation tolerance protein
MNIQQPIIISSTFLDPKKAEEIVFELIEKKLVACAQIFTVESHFKWQGKFERTPETLVQLKTFEHLYSAIELEITNSHPYEIPEIIATPIIHIAKPYLRWMMQELGINDQANYV